MFSTPSSPAVVHNRSRVPAFGSSKLQQKWFNLKDRVTEMDGIGARPFYGGPHADLFQTRDAALSQEEGTSRVVVSREQRASSVQSHLDRLNAKLAVNPERLNDSKFKKEYEKTQQAHAFTQRKVAEATALQIKRTQRVAEASEALPVALKQSDSRLANNRRMALAIQADRARNLQMEHYLDQAAERENVYQAGLTEAEIETKLYLESFIRNLHQTWHNTREELSKKYGEAIATMNHKHQLMLLHLENKHKYDLIPIEEEFHKIEVEQKKAEYSKLKENKLEELKQLQEQATSELKALNEKESRAKASEANANAKKNDEDEQPLPSLPSVPSDMDLLAARLRNLRHYEPYQGRIVHSPRLSNHSSPFS
jgi:hypothetical protein